MSNKQKDRTQALREQGARNLATGDRHPFVDWPEHGHAFVEGVIRGIWKGDFGNVAELEVHEHSDDLAAVTGTGDTRVETLIEVGGKVNVGLNYGALKRVFDGDAAGRYVHIAFTGWGLTKSKQRFRQFEVYDLTDEHPL